MTLKKTKEIIGYYLEKVKVSPEKDPEIQEITREFQKKGYKWLEQKVTYAGIKQRWLIVESAERKQSDIQKLNLKIEQEKKTTLKLRRKLETTGFDTVTQAQNHLKSINKKLKLWKEQIFRNQVKKN
jgi:transposase